MTTTSAYVQDRWIVSPKLTLNLGMRFEHAASEATTGRSRPVSSRVVPRLGAAYDVQGDGDTVLQATFSQYSGKYNAVQFSRNTNVGNSDRYTLVYNGPAGEGRGFAPGFDVNNYSGVVAGTFPALNVQFADDLSSPLTTEYTFGAARTFGARSYAKVALRAAQDLELHRRVHHVSPTAGRRSSSTARRWGSSTTSSTTTATR